MTRLKFAVANAKGRVLQICDKKTDALNLLNEGDKIKVYKRCKYTK